jgi:hypothetical protein
MIIESLEKQPPGPGSPWKKNKQQLAGDNLLVNKLYPLLLIE